MAIRLPFKGTLILHNSGLLSYSAPHGCGMKKKISAQRSLCIADIPYFKPAPPSVPKTQLDAVIEDLIRRKAFKPRTKKTLLSTIRALFMKDPLSDKQVDDLFDVLCKRGVVKVDGTKVSYALPTES